MERCTHYFTQHIERQEPVFVNFEQTVAFRDDAYFSFFWLSLDRYPISHERLSDLVSGFVLVHFVVSDL